MVNDTIQARIVFDTPDLGGGLGGVSGTGAGVGADSRPVTAGRISEARRSPERLEASRHGGKCPRAARRRPAAPGARDGRRLPREANSLREPSGRLRGSTPGS